MKGIFFIKLAFASLLILTTTQLFAQKAMPDEQDILFYINKYRTSKKLPALEMNSYMNKIAKEHSKDMANESTGFGHEGFDDRIDKVDKKLGQSIGSAENVAYGILTAEEVVKGWIHSPGHKRNILGKYTKTGIGVAKGRDGIYFFTQIFTRYN